MFRHKLHYY